MWQSLLLWAGCIPVVVLLAVVSFERWRRKRAGERSPLSEKLLRPAGYSLQRKLDDLDDAYSAWVLSAFLFSLLAVGGLPFVPADNISRAMFLTAFGMVAAGCTVMAWRRLKEIRSHRMGLLGEQAVAEQLQRLLPPGYQIFHDVPGDGKWNIDHVVVGPAGVLPSKPSIAPSDRAKPANATTKQFLTAIKSNSLPAMMRKRRSRPVGMPDGWRTC